MTLVNVHYVQFFLKITLHYIILHYITLHYYRILQQALYICTYVVRILETEGVMYVYKFGGVQVA